MHMNALSATSFQSKSHRSLEKKRFRSFALLGGKQLATQRGLERCCWAPQMLLQPLRLRLTRAIRNVTPYPLRRNCCVSPCFVCV